MSTILCEWTIFSAVTVFQVMLAILISSSDDLPHVLTGLSRSHLSFAMCLEVYCYKCNSYYLNNHGSFREFNKFLSLAFFMAMYILQCLFFHKAVSQFDESLKVKICLFFILLMSECLLM